MGIDENIRFPLFLESREFSAFPSSSSPLDFKLDPRHASRRAGSANRQDRRGNRKDEKMKRNLKTNGSQSGSRASESTRGATPERVLGNGNRNETTNYANSPVVAPAVPRVTRSRSRPPAANASASRAKATREESVELEDEIELIGFGTAVRASTTTTIFKSNPRDSGQSKSLFNEINISSSFNLAGIYSNATTSGTPALPATFPATGTSANIATAFHQAFPQAQPPRSAPNQRRTTQQPPQTEVQQEEDSESGKETQRTGKEGVSKKRKVSS